MATQLIELKLNRANKYGDAALPAVEYGRDTDNCISVSDNIVTAYIKKPGQGYPILFKLGPPGFLGFIDSDDDFPDADNREDGDSYKAREDVTDPVIGEKINAGDLITWNVDKWDGSTATPTFRIKLTRDIDNLIITKGYELDLIVESSSLTEVAYLYADPDEYYGTWTLGDDGIWSYFSGDSTWTYDPVFGWQQITEDPYLQLQYDTNTDEWVIPLYPDIYTLPEDNLYFLEYQVWFDDQSTIFEVQYPFRYKNSDQYNDADKIAPGKYEDRYPYFTSTISDNAIAPSVGSYKDLGSNDIAYYKSNDINRYMISGNFLFTRTAKVVSSIPYYVNATLRRNLIKNDYSFTSRYYAPSVSSPCYSPDTGCSCPFSTEAWPGEISYSTWIKEATLNVTLDGKLFVWQSTDTDRIAVRNLTLHDPAITTKNHDFDILNASPTSSRQYTYNSDIYYETYDETYDEYDETYHTCECGPYTFTYKQTEFEKNVLYINAYPDED